MSQLSIEDLKGGDINPRSTRWVFTWNNYENTPQWDLILDQFFLKIGVVYYIYGKEEGEESHTPHLQGYFRCDKRIYKNTLTNSNIPWYVAVARGSEDENIDYCSKQGNFEEAGSRIRSDKKKKKVTMEELKD